MPSSRPTAMLQVPTSSADVASYGTAPLLTSDPSTTSVLGGRKDDDDSSFRTADLAPTGMVEGPPTSFRSAATPVRTRPRSC